MAPRHCLPWRKCGCKNFHKELGLKPRMARVACLASECNIHTAPGMAQLFVRVDCFHCSSQIHGREAHVTV